jgi:hypothetical protein
MSSTADARRTAVLLGECKQAIETAAARTEEREEEQRARYERDLAAAREEGERKLSAAFAAGKEAAAKWREEKADMKAVAKANHADAVRIEQACEKKVADLEAELKALKAAVRDAANEKADLVAALDTQQSGGGGVDDRLEAMKARVADRRRDVATADAALAAALKAGREADDDQLRAAAAALAAETASLAEYEARNPTQAGGAAAINDDVEEIRKRADDSAKRLRDRTQQGASRDEITSLRAKRDQWQVALEDARRARARLQKESTVGQT